MAGSFDGLAALWSASPAAAFKTDGAYTAR